MLHEATKIGLSALAPIPLAAYLTSLAIEDRRSRLSTVTCLAGLLTYAALLYGILG